MRAYSFNLTKESLDILRKDDQYQQASKKLDNIFDKAIRRLDATAILAETKAKAEMDKINSRVSFEKSRACRSFNMLFSQILYWNKEIAEAETAYSEIMLAITQAHNRIFRDLNERKAVIHTRIMRKHAARLRLPFIDNRLTFSKVMYYDQQN